MTTTIALEDIEGVRMEWGDLLAALRGAGAVAYQQAGGIYDPNHLYAESELLLRSGIDRVGVLSIPQPGVCIVYDVTGIVRRGPLPRYRVWFRSEIEAALLGVGGDEDFARTV